MILLNPELQSKYEQYRNSLRLFAQENPRDRLDIEIGDIKDASIIQPQFKLLRFDNEYNLSVRAMHNEKEMPQVQSDGNRLIWKAGETEIRFYEREKSEELPAGGYEMDQIVNLKKSGNVFYYTLQTKGIDFLQQIELSDQEKEQGNKRPDYIIGGYVLFATNNPLNIEGGKEYRAGKIGEIHAPIITDRAGRFAKCGLLISAERGLMRVTVPDDFAAKAQNPCVLDPTFGYTTAGASYGFYINDDIYGSLFTCPAPSKVSRVSMYLLVGSETNLKSVIVKHSNLNIISNGIASSTVPAGTAWKNCIYSNEPDLDGATEYVLSMITSNNAWYFYYDSGNSNQGHYDTSNNYTTPTNPTDFQHNNNKYSIYAVYTEKNNGFMPFLI